LRPPALDTLGLDLTLGAMCRDFAARTRIHVAYKCAVLPALPESVSIHLYRFLQEALTNIGKHARAHSVRVVLEHEDGMILLVVEDDGVGFDVSDRSGRPAGRLGLVGMQERLTLLNGSLKISSRPGHGTRLEARIPWSGTP
jgi:signal transduction histidine kinase